MSQNKSLYRKKDSKEASISLTKNEPKTLETFNPPHEIDELHHTYQQQSHTEYF